MMMICYQRTQISTSYTRIIHKMIYILSTVRIQ